MCIMHYVHTCYPQMPEERVRSPRTRLTEHCELPFKLGPLENQLNTNFLFHEPGDLKFCLQTKKTVQWLTVDFEILLWLSHL